MQVEGWEYYNHAMVPKVPPHQIPDMRPIENGDIWKFGGEPLFARWTTNWDCGFETNWWYVIKDTPFDIAALKSKRRYEVNKGTKNFVIRVITPCEYKEQLYCIQIAAFSAYPKKYRPLVDKDKFLNGIDAWEKYTVSLPKLPSSICTRTTEVGGGKLSAETSALPRVRKGFLSASRL